ncbi:MAG: alanyl-tRNA editing protein, partial [Pseudomonadota bacterium]
HTISETWITDDELAANPTLVKTLSVKPPSGQGRVRLVRIGPEASPIDLQPCGGTHVASTAEIGQIRLGKIEKKGKQNRRVSLHFAGE